MIINHNLNAMNAHRQSGISINTGAKATEKLSSGLRINRAGDDAAGLAVSEKMRGQIRGLNQASKNAQDGISLIQTAEGALNESHAIAQRMRELAVQAANGTWENTDRDKIDLEFQQLNQELTRIADQTEFNKKKLLDGTITEVKFQIGANADQTISATFSDNDAATIGATGNVKTSGGAQTAIAALDTAIGNLNTNRATLGAVQNRLEHTIKNVDNASENLQAAESRIRDTDMAKEMMEFTRSSILAQASQAMLAQANQQPQNVLQLLR